jgi:hypothetical protein
MKTTKFITVLFLGLLILTPCINGAENKKAREIGDFVMSTYLVQCEEGSRHMKVNGECIQLRADKNKFTTTLTEEPLSESDKLNGINYIGMYKTFYSGPARKYLGDRWGDWQNYENDIILKIIQKGDTWSSELARVNDRATWFTCSSLTRPLGNDPVIGDQLIMAKDLLDITRGSIQKTMPKSITLEYLNEARIYIKQAGDNAGLKMSISNERQQKLVMAGRSIVMAINDFNNGRDISRLTEEAKRFIDEYITSSEESNPSSSQEKITKIPAPVTETPPPQKSIIPTITISEKYNSWYNKDSYIGFDKDGTFSGQVKTSKGMQNIYGKYQFDGENMTLFLSTGQTDKGKIKGDIYIDGDGWKWVKK